MVDDNADGDNAAGDNAAGDNADGDNAADNPALAAGQEMLDLAADGAQ